MTDEERISIAELLAGKGFEVEADEFHIIAEKEGCRLSVLLGTDGHLDAVLEEIADTSTIIKLESKESRGVALSWKTDGSRLVFIRKDAVSETAMTIF